MEKGRGQATALSRAVSPQPPAPPVIPQLHHKLGSTGRHCQQAPSQPRAAVAEGQIWQKRVFFTEYSHRGAKA